MSEKRKKQFGALVYRESDGTVEVLLVTSRESGRWVIPKGWPMKLKLPHRAAAQEAFEEAGVRGRISHRAIGTFDYDKRRRDGSLVPCRVVVYPMAVSDLLEDWPEADQRQRAWFAPADAAERVNEPELAALLRHVEEGAVALPHLAAA
ncbi:NUDIX hydrolase [Mangrovibrevibacter kandeliae]|uniref:NUDIX hydrolase n=1 Tax=Mangrovibrevibacter kandeliae TaxID=2968473 RepID=UPI0021190BFE|nr:NUDIX hydrolase [Aurantimonas sp. MSK8Z-1]MCQ8784060.1 NUDIX hydrolase [Aurantimonas sp. CSK15Z-1]MCW4116777.1 NUDIX hydrolase [Aurantimonas sp. MSK8Z-1]